jgi:hypothetical protein
MNTIHRRICPTHGMKLKMRDPKDGSDTRLAFCQFCGRYYGRVMNSEKFQLRGFHPADAGYERVDR